MRRHSHFSHCDDDRTRMPRRALAWGLCLLACSLLPATAVVNAAHAQDCIDYGDYIHCVGGVDTPGSAVDVEVSGELAYVADGDFGLQVVDISNVTSPVIIGNVDTPGSALGVAVEGDHALVAAGYGGLSVVDISTPTAPRIAGRYVTGWAPVEGVTVSGGHAFIAADSGLEIIDFSDPAAPRLVGRVGIYLSRAVVVAGNYAYVTAYGGVAVVDISDLTAPGVVAHLSMPAQAYGLAVAGHYAYVADGDGLQVVDVSVPTAPAIVGSVATPDFAVDVAVAGDYAYVLDGRLQVVNVSDPTAPVIVGTVNTSWRYAHSVAVARDHAYVGDAEAGLQVVDISSSALPEMVGSVAIPINLGAPTAVAVEGSYACVTTAFGVRGGVWYYLVVVDISDPSSPVIVGSLGLSTSARVAVAGNYAYVTAGGLQVVDISIPASPQIVGSVATPAVDVAVAGDYAYVTSGGSLPLLQVVDITNPTAPAIVGGVGLPDPAADVVVAGGYAYVTAGGLQVVDISTPASPQIVGSVGTIGGAVDVAGDLACVVGASGLEVVDITNPTAPTIVGGVVLPDWPRAVSVSGAHAYVACGLGERGSLQVVDISDPALPTMVGGIDLGQPLFWATDVVVAGDYAYVAKGLELTAAGLLAICFTQCEVTTPVVLGSYELATDEGAVRMVWDTSFEEDHVGFHVERAGEGSDSFDRVNDELIRGSGDRGRRYEFVDRAVVTGETYVYRLVAVGVNGGTQTFSLGSVTVGRVLPATLVLQQNHPNPFNPSTSIAFELPEATHVTLRIYDVSGSLVRTLVDTRLARSAHAVEWDGRDDFGREVGSGVYHYRIETGAQSISRKMIMVH